MKKVLAILILVPMLSGCYAGSRGIPLFNNYGYNYTPNSVVVQKGDTLYNLSRKYEVPLRSLIEENNLSAPYTLSVGQNLRLPVRQTHTVVRGDTLYSISKKYDVDITSLSKLNSLDSPYTLNVGQTLALPDSVSGIKKTQTVQNTPVQGDFSSYRIKQITALPTKNTSKTTAATPKNTTISKKIAKTTPRKTVSTYRKSKFIWPVNGAVVSNFGVVGKGRRNDGINIKATTGTNVKAADKGVVAYAGSELKGFGNLVLIKHSDGYITAYAHNDKLYVKKGQAVLRGEKIATVGSTGSVNTPQLHFEVRAGKKAVNPRQYLP